MTEDFARQRNFVITQPIEKELGTCREVRQEGNDNYPFLNLNSENLANDGSSSYTLTERMRLMGRHLYCCHSHILLRRSGRGVCVKLRLRNLQWPP